MSGRCVTVGGFILRCVWWGLPFGAGCQWNFGAAFPRERYNRFLVDLSESNAANLTQMEQYMSRQVKDMPKNNQYAIVTFGANAVVEQFLTSEKHSFQILSAPEADATNLEEAVSTGLSMILDNAAGRLVVLTDGKQTKETSSIRHRH